MVQEPMPRPAKEEEESEWKENLVAILVVAIITLVVVGYFLGWFTPAPAPTAPADLRYLIDINDDPLIGNFSAPNTIILFGDHTSPYTRAFFNETFPELKAQYIDTGKVRFVFRDYPLTDVRPQAFAVSVALECAHAQDAFWEFRQRLYARDTINESIIHEIADSLNLDKVAFADCRASPATTQEVEQDILTAVNDGGVVSVPTLFINGHRLVGNKPLATIVQLFNDTQKT